MVPTDNPSAGLALLSRLIDRNDHGYPLYQLPLFESTCQTKQHPMVSLSLSSLLLLLSSSFFCYYYYYYNHCCYYYYYYNHCCYYYYYMISILVSLQQ